METACDTTTLLTKFSLLMMQIYYTYVRFYQNFTYLQKTRLYKKIWQKLFENYEGHGL